jgi:MFS family permease
VWYQLADGMNTAPATIRPAPGRDADPAPRRARRAALLLGAAAFVVYCSALREIHAGDTLPARLLPFSLVQQGNLDLDEFDWLRAAEPNPYFLRLSADGAHWRSKYPVATPLLATPLAVPLAWWAAAHGIDNHDARFRLLTFIFERTAAALLGALTVAVTLLATREIAPWRWALAATLCAAFGSSLWPYSLGLWQHPLAALATAATILMMVRPPTPRRAFLMGAFASLGVAARPTMIVVLAVVTLFMWRERRRLVAWMAGPVIAGVGGVAIVNLFLLGHAHGGYSLRLHAPELAGFLGLFVSPSRGLFLYTPLALLALAALGRRTAPVALRYLALAVPAYGVVFASSWSWWGGWSYGPRFFTDLVPLLAVCALPAARRLWRRRAGRVLLVAGALWAVGVQAIGVYGDHEDWNAFPINVDRRDDRLWSWSDPQIVRTLATGWHGGELGPLLYQLFTDPRPVPLVPLAPEQLAGTIEPVTPAPWRCRAGRPCAAELRVTNGSSGSMWPAHTDYGPYPVGIGAWWSSGDVAEPLRPMWAHFPRHLGPGETARIRLPIAPPSRPGAYVLTIAVLQDQEPGPPARGSSIAVPVVVE